MNSFKPGDKVRRIKSPYGQLSIGSICTVESQNARGLYLVEYPSRCSAENFELVKEPEMIEEWKPGWVVRNTDSNAEHTVSRVDTDCYWMRHNKSNTEWFLSFDMAKQMLGDSRKYTVVSREEILTELPCVKVIPPVNIPERKEIQQGELYPYSSFQVQKNSTSQVYISLDSNKIWMSKNSLRKTAQAMNILASILEENEKDNG